MQFLHYFQSWDKRLLSWEKQGLSSLHSTIQNLLKECGTRLCLCIFFLPRRNHKEKVPLLNFQITFIFVSNYVLLEATCILCIVLLYIYIYTHSYYYIIPYYNVIVYYVVAVFVSPVQFTELSRPLNKPYSFLSKFKYQYCMTLLCHLLECMPPSLNSSTLPCMTPITKHYR